MHWVYKIKNSGNKWIKIYEKNCTINLYNIRMKYPTYTLLWLNVSWYDWYHNESKYDNMCVALI